MKREDLFYTLGLEETLEELEDKNTEEFDGQEELKRELLLKLQKNTTPRKKQIVGSKKGATKKRMVLIAAIIASLAISLTTLAAIKGFMYNEKLEGNGNYELAIQENKEKPASKTIVTHVKVTKANYVPPGYVINEEELKQDGKFMMYKEGEEPYGLSGITVFGDAIRENTITMANVTASENIMLGNIPGKLLTTFSQDGSTGYDVLAFHEEEGYFITVFGMQSGLSPEELKKIAENIVVEVTKETLDADTAAQLEEIKKLQNKDFEMPQIRITAENIVNIGDMVQSLWAQDTQMMKEWAQNMTEEELAAAFKVMYSIDSAEVSDTLPSVDLNTGYVSEYLTEHMNDDTTLKSVNTSYAKMNSSTGNIDVITEKHEGRYIKATVTLYNPTSVEINDYYYMAFLNFLEQNKDGTWTTPNDDLAYFTEPVYLSFQDYPGKSAYRMNFKPGEKRTITAVYTVDSKLVDQAYLMVSTGGDAGDGKCWNHFIKVQ
ncbi:DUF4367 domain-containing protein [Faecalicatena contorta]|uniref:DUF4367 domain-containing protein n=1 Tax=Faecalicatena contorta TaxID=39482 RepID=A0A315ZNR8_9FIRM|nr:DUF4367 domain-containing protein [Faecalicatena contorta]PWJ46962.1 uncharacterized protein DUF4367 [Faecalicatena contorta]SUQ16290.1 protein of unknown function [Faecalicatena contorta]